VRVGKGPGEGIAAMALAQSSMDQNVFTSMK
jgi:hypothetical protein